MRWDGHIRPCLLRQLYNSENSQMHIGKPSMGNRFKEYEAEAGGRLGEGRDPSAEPLRTM